MSLSYAPTTRNIDHTKSVYLKAFTFLIPDRSHFLSLPGY
jgi:hypothetical protein